MCEEIGVKGGEGYIVEGYVVEGYIVEGYVVAGLDREPVNKEKPSSAFYHGVKVQGQFGQGICIQKVPLFKKWVLIEWEDECEDECEDEAQLSLS